MEITIKRGDILELAKEKYILHQVNEDGVMGGGLALQIANKYPKVEKEYKKYVNRYTKKELYGTYQIVETDDGRYIVNCFTQKNYNTNYDALTKILTELKQEIGKEKIAMPYMYGCGIADGGWNKVYNIIKNILEENVVLYNYNNKIIMYKATDENMTCRGLQYNFEDTFEQKEELELCGKGFHACRNFKDIEGYYDILNSEIYEIEMLGDIIDGDDKSSSNKIKFIKEIIGEELESLKNIGKNNTGCWNSGNSNSGNWNSGNSNIGYSNVGHSNAGNSNSGNWNSGNSNIGYSNSGNSNSGHSNIGHSNAGNWNTGNSNAGNTNTGNWNRTNRETGHFNTVQSNYINIFNSPCERELWKDCNKPSFLYFDLIEWIYEKNMTDKEKNNNPSYKTTRGYLKSYEYKEAFQKSYNDLSNYEQKEQTKLLKKLPNFDADVFYEISGIRIERDDV